MECHGTRFRKGDHSTVSLELLGSRHGLACCCTEIKLQSFKLNDKRSPRGANETLHKELVMVDVAMECHGEFAQVTTRWPGCTAKRDVVRP